MSANELLSQRGLQHCICEDTRCPIPILHEHEGHRKCLQILTVETKVAALAI
jgi:hypothetical protein